MYYWFFFYYNKVVVIIVSVFCWSVLNVVYGDCDVLILKGYYNNGRMYFGFELIVYKLLFV